MTRARYAHSAFIISIAVATSLGGCSSDNTDDPGSSGGTPGASGGSGGAAASGGSPVAGSNFGGSPVAGSNFGGSPVAGTSMGGAATAGTSMGGAAAGDGGKAGSANAGSSTGGATAGSGGTSTAGSGGKAGAAGGGGKGGGAGAGGNAPGGAGAGGSGGGGTSLSAGCGKTPTIASNMYNNGNPISIMAGNKQRRYILTVPANYDNSKAYRLVIAWHQLDGNDKQMYQQNYYWLKDIPDAASSTIFVAPNGEKGGNPCTGMGNGESQCGWPDSNGAQIALADAVVTQVTDNFCVDKNKIFANGWSYGGSMSYRTACSRPLGGTGTWGVRAVAVYNGAAQLSAGGCMPSKSVAFYASHGTNDGVLGYDGGVSMAQTYARVNGCTWATPTRANGGTHVCTNIMGCMTGYPVEFCSFVGDHTPDPRDNNQRWQPQEVWKFFSQF